MTTPATASAPATVKCANCGASLDGLPIDEVCGQCRAPLRESLAPPGLRIVAATDARKLEAAVSLLGFALLVQFAGALLWQGLSSRLLMSFGFNSSTWFTAAMVCSSLFYVARDGLVLAAALRLTRIDMSPDGARRAAAWRMAAVPVAGIALLSGILTSVAWLALPGNLYPLLEMFNLLGGVASEAAFLLVIVVARRLSDATVVPRLHAALLAGVILSLAALALWLGQRLLLASYGMSGELPSIAGLIRGWVPALRSILLVGLLFALVAAQKALRGVLPRAPLGSA